MSVDIMMEWLYAGSRYFEEPTEGFPGMLTRTLDEQGSVL